MDSIDSFLYLHRKAAHFIYAPPEKKVILDSPEYWDTYWDVKLEKLEEEDNMEKILYGL